MLNADAPEMAAMGLLTGDVLSTNLFAYCQNNPVNRTDPTGHWSVAGFANSLNPSTIFNSFMLALYNDLTAALVSVGLFVTKTLLPKVASALWWQPWLVAGIVVAAVAIVVAAVVIVHNQTLTKADSKVKSTVKKGLPTLYWSANLGKGCVDIGRSLTYAEALAEVKAGRSVFTVTKALAGALALAAGGSIHDNKHKNAIGYYHHYHVNRTNPAHIWYLFDV